MGIKSEILQAASGTECVLELIGVEPISRAPYKVILGTQAGVILEIEVQRTDLFLQGAIKSGVIGTVNLQ